MHYPFLIAMGLFFLASCATDNETMRLSGNVKGLKKGILFLQKIEDTSLVTVDSIIIDGNSDFYFSEKIKNPEIYYLFVRLKDATLRDDRIEFFAESGEININTTLKNFGSTAIVTGSANDEALKKYLELKDRYVTKNLNLIEERLKLGNKPADSTWMKIEAKQQALLSRKYFATINFAMNNKDKEVAPYLMLREVYDANVKYLDTVYRALEPKIKDSKYGRELESLIINRKKADTIL